jgi:hypothetical protein
MKTVDAPVFLDVQVLVEKRRRPSLGIMPPAKKCCTIQSRPPSSRNAVRSYCFRDTRRSVLRLPPRRSAKFSAHSKRAETTFSIRMKIWYHSGGARWSKPWGWLARTSFFRPAIGCGCPVVPWLIQTVTMPEQELAKYQRRIDWTQTDVFIGNELAFVGE